MKILVWVVALATLSIGARNFETGLSIDGPLYGTIARNVARTGEWFRLDSMVPDFQPFAEHPHLGFWVGALCFRIFPAADWAARIPGHLFYVGFLLMFFVWLRRRASVATCTLSILLLWIWPDFGNYFSNFYLDPGALFFGAAALFLLDLGLAHARLSFGLAAGFALATCALYKGVTVLGFGPACAYLVFCAAARPGATWRAATLTITTLLAFALPLLIYAAKIHQSAVPNFLELYWSHQITHRFAPMATVAGLFHWQFFSVLLHSTHYLAILALASLPKLKSKNDLILPWILIASFVCAFAPTERYGAQYGIMLLPWVAWLIADALSGLVVRPDRWMFNSGAFALFAVAFLQYGATRVHSRRPPSEVDEINFVKSKVRLDKLILGLPMNRADYLKSSASQFTWYDDVAAEYAAGTARIPPANFNSAYLRMDGDLHSLAEIGASGWCLEKNFGRTSLWLACGSPTFSGPGT